MGRTLANQRTLRSRFYGFFFAAYFAAFSLSGSAHAQSNPPLQLNPGDRIAVMGGGLADRMQHDGWLETYLQARFPEHQLVVRHLGFTGDELTLRMRSQGFGSPADWLKRTQANVVFAFFGYNESFRGEAELGKFKKDLRKFVEETLKTSGAEQSMRLVLFSPIAYEDLGDLLLPDSNDLNPQLSIYTAGMAEVAKELKVPFVDLFQPSQEFFGKSSDAMTINGIHLNETGNREIAKIIDRTFEGPLSTDEETLEKIRAAVVDKNFQWYQRYRTTDGFSIFGGRKGAGGSRWTPKNEPIMQREMEILDVMTANRDEQIWKIAQGYEHAVDDSNTPPLIPVGSNKPGPLGDGSYPFLGGEEAIKQMTAAEGTEINLFGSEETFPELQNPVQAAVDTKGRLWVSVWPSYPHWSPKDEMNDKLLILEDTDGDGRADRCKTFADGLHNPTGFEFYNGGVYVAQVPDIWFFKDTDGDDVADIRERVIGGIDSADTHHSINSFVIGPGGGLYFQEGIFHRTQIETPYGPPTRLDYAGVLRYDPKNKDCSVYANYRFANPHGHVYTYWGDDIIHNGTSADPYFGPAVSIHSQYPAKLGRAPTIYNKRTRPCPSTAILSSKHFPDTNRDTLLVCNVIGVQGILQYRLEEDGAGVKGIEVEPLVTSQDPNFRPVDLEVGSDGAVYFLDWQNPLIGHLQHNLRDSNRDHLHGRVYRLRYKQRKLLDGPVIADQPLEQLFELLKERDNGIRYRAKIELSSRPGQEVVAACQAWIASLDEQAEDYEHHLLEALWVHQHNHTVNEPLLHQLLASSDYRVRAAAGHVLRAWREKIPDVVSAIESLVRDEHPRVRLVGILVCSDMGTAAAAELALEAAKMPRDKFLDYVLAETTKTLSPAWKRQLAEGKPFCAENPAALVYLLRSTSPKDLLKLGQHEHVYEGLLALPAVNAKVRFRAVQALAGLRKSKPLDLLLDTIVKIDASESASIDDLVGLLAEFADDDLRSAEDRFLKLAVAGQSGSVRQGALAAIARVDASADRAWQMASGSSEGLVDLLTSVKRIPDEAARAVFYDRVRPVLLDPSRATLKETSSQTLDKVETSAIDAIARIPGHDQQRVDDLLGILEQNRHRAEVVSAILAIPASGRTAEQAARLIAATTEYLATVEPSKRASGDAYDEMQLAIQFAELLPEERREDAIQKLKSFGVRLIKLSTIPHRMSYDQQKLVVQAGEPVQLVFSNPDNMPHNFVVTRPGRLAQIGMLAETQATQPATIARQFVPKTDNVLISSNLLQAGEQQVLDFHAPTSPGVYPFVCTYPGHWRRMFGSLYVVEDLQAYQADPPTYLAARSINPEDELLKFNRPLHKWTFEELKPSLNQLTDDKDFRRGSQLFQIASCGACHSVQEGQPRFAPDLATLDPKRTPEDILRSIVNPSKEIDKKYQMSQFLLDSGKAVVGLVVEETPQNVTLMVDPLTNCVPTILDKEEIEERYESDISLMPSGLLDRFTEEEIMELCAYVVSRCNQEDPIYQQND